MATDIEIAAMRRAIAISAQGIGTTSPNPPVGCVVLDSAGKVVGEGYHRRKGEAHAEVNALAAAGERARGGTAVVTLEPCNHHGRTPPCRQALLDAGVSRVVVALLDPTSRGEGGVAVLRQAGVSVEVGVLVDEALLVLGDWRRSLEAGRAVVTWAHALSVAGERVSPPADGVIAADLHQLCSRSDVVITDGMVLCEGNPDGHDRDLSHPAVGEDASGPEVLASLAERGARTVILVGGDNLADRFLGAGLVRRTVTYAPSSSPSWTPPVGRPPTIVVPGYHMTDVLALDGWVRVTADRDA